MVSEARVHESSKQARSAAAERTPSIMETGNRILIPLAVWLCACQSLQAADPSDTRERREAHAARIETHLGSGAT